MNHEDHVNLLRGGVVSTGGTWADFGAGSGAFTLALADLLGPAAEIIAIDLDPLRLHENEQAMQRRFPGTNARYMTADFGSAVELSQLDGIVCANALHFTRDQARVVRLLRGYLRPGGRMLVVEYNIDRPNRAVPYPIPFDRWQSLARGAELAHTELLARRPSRFLREIYSSASW